MKITILAVSLILVQQAFGQKNYGFNCSTVIERIDSTNDTLVRTTFKEYASKLTDDYATYGYYWQFNEAKVLKSSIMRTGTRSYLVKYYHYVGLPWEKNNFAYMLEAQVIINDECEIIDDGFVSEYYWESKLNSKYYYEKGELRSTYYSYSKPQVNYVHDTLGETTAYNSKNEPIAKGKRSWSKKKPISYWSLKDPIGYWSYKVQDMFLVGKYSASLQLKTDTVISKGVEFERPRLEPMKRGTWNLSDSDGRKVAKVKYTKQGTIRKIKCYSVEYDEVLKILSEVAVIEQAIW